MRGITAAWRYVMFVRMVGWPARTRDRRLRSDFGVKEGGAVLSCVDDVDIATMETKRSCLPVYVRERV